MSANGNPPTSSTRSHLRLPDVLVLGACVALLAAFMLVDTAPRYPAPPDFASMEPEQKKREFFAYLSPIISEVNFRLAADRDRVKQIRAAVARGERPGWGERRWLERLAARLEVDLGDMELAEALEVLERRAGVVPESLVLIQAAVESGWGTSRFALEGNNYFGQRCYRTNCGIVPFDRAEGARFGLAEFATAAESVESYILNLNTHESYREFRERRQRRRNAGLPITGLSLVEALDSYSERGGEYIEQIASMIRSNGLE